MNYVGTKNRSLVQVKKCVHSRGQSFDDVFMALFQNRISMKSRSYLKLHTEGSETRSRHKENFNTLKRHSFAPVFFVRNRNTGLIGPL